MVSLWDKVTLGRTGLRVSRLGLASSYGIGSPDVERAFERGINYFYWGSQRTGRFGKALRNLAPRHRDEMVVVVQSYTRAASLMRGSLERALRELDFEYADFLLLGWWNQLPPKRILDAAMALRDAGLAKHIMISCHNRPSLRVYAADERFGALMLRYNAAHPGAEKDVFPFLGESRPGVVSYTATRWGQLLQPKYMPAGVPTPRASDCYRFALTSPHVDVCLTGPEDAAQLDEALAALDRGAMSEDDLAWMKRVGEAVHGVRMRASLASVVGFLDRMMGAR